MKKLLLALPILTLAACEPAEQRSEEEIQKIVKDYLMENPEIIIGSVERYQEEIALQAEQKSQEQLVQLLPQLTSTGPFIGPESSDNIVVEFFDYNCGYCKRSLESISQLHAENPDVKIIFKELPILSPNSELLARAALAVHKKDPAKYMEFHSALMKNKAAASKATLVGIASQIGVSGVDFEKDLNDPEITKEIEANRELTAKIGVRGTPAFIINGELVGGAVPYEELKSKLKK